MEVGCRHIKGLDGCFLRSKFNDELLVALGRDGNEQNFPITWACMKSETKLNWVWFLTLIKGELELGEGVNLLSYHICKKYDATH